MSLDAINSGDLGEFKRRLAKANSFWTAGGLARFLKAQGITGRRCASGDCPLAKWMAGSGYDTYILLGMVYIRFTDTTTHRIPLGILSKAATRFYCKFDKGKYPALDEVAPQGM